MPPKVPQSTAPQTEAATPMPVAVASPSAPVDQATFLAALDMLLKNRGVEQANGLTADQLTTILSENAKSVQRALKPENPTAPNVSAYNPTGEAKPILSCTLPDGTVRPRKTFFVGARMDEDLLTPLEITLFNRFTTSKSLRNGRWTATVKQNGNDQELHVMVPHKEIDDRQNLPNGLTLILRELLDGEEAANPEALIARLEAAEAKLAALSAA